MVPSNLGELRLPLFGHTTLGTLFLNANLTAGAGGRGASSPAFFESTWLVPWQQPSPLMFNLPKP